MSYRKIYSTLALLTSFVGTTVSAEPISIQLNNLMASEGQIVVQVYNTKRNWMSDDKDEILLQHTHKFSNHTSGTIQKIDFDLDQGDYALFLFLDLDGNSELKTNWIGIPKEPVGTSNNAKGSMGPPAFKDALFSHQNNTVLEIKLNSLD